MSARDVILGRIRAATGGPSAVPAATPAPGSRSFEPSTRENDTIDLLVEMLSEYRATVSRTTESRLQGDIRQAWAKRGARRLLVAPGFPGQWLPPALELTGDDGSTNSLVSAEGVITTCALAIAQTGTIVLDGGTGQGRRALTLIPDYHLCIVEAERVVASVTEAVERLAPAVTAGLPLTLISGPSATSDIELIRVEGVHGPRNLEVLIVE